MRSIQVMDFYKKKSNKAGIRGWVKRINSGEFVVSKKLNQNISKSRSSVILIKYLLKK